MLVWPVAAIVRRRYKAPLALPPASLKAYRWSRIAVGADPGGTCAVAADLHAHHQGHQQPELARWIPLIWFAQLFGVVAFFGGVLLMLWNAKDRLVAASVAGPPRPGASCSPLSAVAVLWVALVCKLLSFGTNY